MRYMFQLPEDYKGVYFNGSYLKERFDKLITYDGINVYDTLHAIEQFHARFPELSDKRYYDALTKGLRKISDKWDFQENQYVIISNKYNIKIPIQIRPDEQRPSVLLGVTPSTLNAEEQPINLRDEIEILVEETKNNHGFAQRREFTEEQVGYIDKSYFNHYIEEGIHYQDFEEIFVD